MNAYNVHTHKHHGIQERTFLCMYVCMWVRESRRKVGEEQH